MSIVISDGLDNEPIRRGLTYLKIIDIAYYDGDFYKEDLDWLTRVIAYNFNKVRDKKSSVEISTRRIVELTFSGSVLKGEYMNSTLKDAIKYALLWEK